MYGYKSDPALSAAVPRKAAGCGLSEAEKSFIPNTKVNITLVEEMAGRRGRRAFFLSGGCIKSQTENGAQIHLFVLALAHKTMAHSTRL